MHSPDVSYNLTIVALWTWGEIRAGTLICCLPVTSQFFKHYNSKIRLLSRGSKSSTQVGGNPEIDSRKEICETMLRHQHRFDTSIIDSGCKTWAGRCSDYQPEPTGKFISLDELFAGWDSGDSMNVRVHGTATRRNDVESGRYAL